MPRTKQLKKVVAPPRFKGYKPYGCPDKSNGCIELLYEEYEAIKLADYDIMNHQQASKLMGTSRATFARIYESARRKIAKAMVEAKEIKTVYGNAYFDNSWFICTNCDAKFTIPYEAGDKKCPLCKSNKLETLKK